MKLVMTIAIAATACVSTGTYNKKVDELTAAAKQREGELGDKIKGLETKLETTQGDLDKAVAEKGALQAQLDNAKELDASLTARLEKLGQNVDSLSKEKADVATRLEELKKQKAAADARIATFRNLLVKLRAMIDSGQLKVAIRGGRMIIALPNDILFDSGKTEVKTEGKTALDKVAQVLATVGDRDFLVAGHTDNVPIKMPKFPSNWELSTARAVEVVHFLIAKGMKPKTLAAAGYGEFDPVVANDTNEHRAQNRRIEIVLQPNIGDLPPLDDLNPTPAAPAKK